MVRAADAAPTVADPSRPGFAATVTAWHDTIREEDTR